jgi:rhodanese-related sulfurtransferase
MKKLLVLMMMFVVVLTGCSGGSYTSIEASELDQYMVANPDAIYIDVRTPEEFKSGNVEGFINIDSMVATDKITDTYSKDEQIVLICNSGNRSSSVAQQLVSAGYTNVVNVEGGMVEYNK